VRDAWTSDGTTATNSKSTVVSESSYLPFLFHAEDQVSPSFNGRRSFAKGKEVIPQPEPAQSSDPLQPTVAKLESDSVSGGSGAGLTHHDDALIKPKREKRTASVSGFKSSLSATSPVSRPPGKKPTLPASSLIYQDADVGVDLGSARRAARDRAGFIKPADVDALPRDSQPPRKSAVLSIVENARAQVEQNKRSIDGSYSSTRSTDGPLDSPRKKRKSTNPEGISG